MTALKLGTRGSQLALAQAERVASLLRARGREVELVKIQTTGDRLRAENRETSGKAAWVQEIETALLDSTIDLAVHSAKDLPADLADGLTIGSFPEREDPRDAFIGAVGRRFGSLPPGARVGTGSLRRTALLKALWPELEVAPIRGNVPTRLEKIETMELDGVILRTSRGGAPESVRSAGRRRSLPRPGPGTRGAARPRSTPFSSSRSCRARLRSSPGCRAADRAAERACHRG